MTLLIISSMLLFLLITLMMKKRIPQSLHCLASFAFAFAVLGIGKSGYEMISNNNEPIMYINKQHNKAIVTQFEKCLKNSKNGDDVLKCH